MYISHNFGALTWAFGGVFPSLSQKWQRLNKMMDMGKNEEIQLSGSD